MDMMEEFAFYGSLILRCIIVYFVIIFALRVMGKREVGELSVFDVVIYLVMFVVGMIWLMKWEEFPLTARFKKNKESKKEGGNEA